MLKNFIKSFGGIFAPQRNKFKSKKQKHEESAHQDFRPLAGTGINFVHLPPLQEFQIKKKTRMPCLQIKVSSLRFQLLIICQAKQTRNTNSSALSCLQKRVSPCSRDTASKTGRNNPPPPHLPILHKAAQEIK